VTGLVGISRDLPDLRLDDSVPAALRAALEFLEAHFSAPLTASDLAGRAGLPPVRFARFIKRVFRVTPSQLIAQTRLAAASRMLSGTSLSVSEIAHACGFYDHSAFTRAFRTATGLTPRAFRSRNCDSQT
jgi:AraC-like DNA-binding protein